MQTAGPVADREGNGGNALPAGTLLEIYISPEGRYVGGNDALMALLGYTASELTRLPLGALSGNDPGAAREIWLEQVAGHIAFAASRGGRFVTKSGTQVPALYLGVEADRPDGCYTSRAVTVCPNELPSHGPSLPTVLGEWREAERALASLRVGDPRRAALEIQVERLRAIYQIESRLRRR